MRVSHSLLQLLRRNRCGAIGLDIGTTAAHMVQLAPVGNGLRVAAAARADLPPESVTEAAGLRAPLAETLERMLACGSFHGRAAIVCLPDKAIQFKNVRMPQMPPEELAQAVEFEAADRFNLGNRSATVRHLCAGRVKHGEDVLEEVVMMAATDESLSPYIGALQDAGLRPLAIDVTPTALARCISRIGVADNEADAQTVSVVVDIGRATTKVLILRGAAVGFYKHVDIACDALDTALASTLQIPLEKAVRLRRHYLDKPPDAAAEGNTQQGVGEAIDRAIGDLVREIGLCMRYYSVTFRGAGPRQLWLCGGGGKSALLAAKLQEQLDINVTMVEPFAGMDLSGSLLSTQPGAPTCDWAVSAGVALRQATAERKRRGAA